jgi:ParB-like chromosome segregation protein Spo0J
MQIINKPIKELTPYEKNPRKNDEAVKYVKASIEQFGFKV